MPHVAIVAVTGTMTSENGGTIWLVLLLVSRYLDDFRLGVLGLVAPASGESKLCTVCTVQK